MIVIIQFTIFHLPPLQLINLKIQIYSFITWAAHVARRERFCLKRNLVGKAEGKRPLGKRAVDVKIILKWLLMRLWTGFNSLRIGSSGGLM
jgi:hypothetical protein